MLYKNILLIDDDPDDAEIFMEAIDAIHKDIVCRIATNPVQAFEELKLSEKLPDLLFLDINMPCLNGLDFLQQLKNDARLLHIEVILISSPSEEVIRKLSPKYDIGKYMAKPHSYSEYIAQLKKIIL